MEESEVLLSNYGAVGDNERFFFMPACSWMKNYKIAQKMYTGKEID